MWYAAQINTYLILWSQSSEEGAAVMINLLFRGTGTYQSDH